MATACPGTPQPSPILEGVCHGWAPPGGLRACCGLSLEDCSAVTLGSGSNSSWRACVLLPSRPCF